MSSEAPPDHLTLGEALRLSTQHLADRGVESAALDASLLLGHALGLSRLQVHLQFERPLTDEEREAIRPLLARRARREPVAHILGRREFYGREFTVTPDTLIPRPETELLVERLLDLDSAERVPAGAWADIGTGSGCLAVTLACERESRTIHATDISETALAVAAQNVERHGVGERVALHRGDLFADIAEHLAAVVSNTPYVAEGLRGSLMPEVEREPAGALFAGADGLDVIRRLAAEVPRHLVSGGWLLIEVGHDQGERVRELIAGQAGWREVRLTPDLQGIPRAVEAQRV